MLSEIKKIKDIFRSLQISKFKLFLFTFLEILISGLSVVYPYFLGKIISLSIKNDSQSFHKIYYYTLFFVIILLVWLVVGYFNEILLAKENRKLLSNLRKRLLKALFLMPYFIKEKNGSGYYQERILTETESIKDLFYRLWSDISSTIVGIIIIFLIMIYISPLLTLLSMIILPVSSYVAKKTSPKIYHYTKENKEIKAKLSELYQ